jgi:hypothetical protein
MNIRSARITERLAKVSRVSGILSVGLLVIAGSILIYARFFLGDADWASGLGIIVFGLLLFFISLVLGVSACITALIALKRNREDGDDQTIRKTAYLGLVPGLAGVVVILLFYAVVWLLTSSAPPAEIRPPMHSTTVP